VRSMGEEVPHSTDSSERLSDNPRPNIFYIIYRSEKREPPDPRTLHFTRARRLYVPLISLARRHSVRFYGYTQNAPDSNASFFTMKFCKNLQRVVDISDPEWAPYWTNYKMLKVGSLLTIRRCIHHRNPFSIVSYGN
jgi:hypothetical protein